MSFLNYSNVDDVHHLLTRLQGLYWDLMNYGTFEKTDYYRQRIAVIEQARPSVSSLMDDCYIILDEFSSEYQVIQAEHLKVVLQSSEKL